MATSGARVQLALAPAGTGKTTAMAVLAAAWRHAGGTVIGLAPTASAAEVLAEDLGSTTDTIDKLVDLQRNPPSPDDAAHTWYSTHRPRDADHRRRSRHGRHRRPGRRHRPRPDHRRQRAADR